jgi:hypothetical protein
LSSVSITKKYHLKNQFDVKRQQRPPLTP